MTVRRKKKQASVSTQLLMSYAARLVVIFISSQQKHSLSEHFLVSGKTSQELYYSLSVVTQSSRVLLHTG